MEQNKKTKKNPTIFFKNILYVMCNIYHMFSIDHGMMCYSMFYIMVNHIISKIVFSFQQIL